MVARLSFCSVSLAQKPKSAVKKGKVSVSVLHQVDEGGRGDELTDLNVALAVEEDVVALDISVDDILLMQVIEALARLTKAVHSQPPIGAHIVLQH